MILLHKSVTSERVWVLVHSDPDPYLIGAWYRPPEPGRVVSTTSLRQEEHEELSQGTVGTIIVDDMNIHHKRWLWRSDRNSAERELLHKFCLDNGLQQQLVREATRQQLLARPCAIV